MGSIRCWLLIALWPSFFVSGCSTRSVDGLEAGTPMPDDQARSPVGDLTCPRPSPATLNLTRPGAFRTTNKNLVVLPPSSAFPVRRGGPSQLQRRGQTAAVLRVCEGHDEPADCVPGVVLVQDEIASWHPEPFGPGRETEAWLAEDGSAWLTSYDDGVAFVEAGEIRARFSSPDRTRINIVDGPEGSAVVTPGRAHALEVWGRGWFEGVVPTGERVRRIEVADDVLHVVSAQDGIERLRLARKGTAAVQSVSAAQVRSQSVRVTVSGQPLPSTVRWYCVQGSGPTRFFSVDGMGTITRRIQAPTDSCSSAALFGVAEVGLFVAETRGEDSELYRVNENGILEPLGQVPGAVSSLASGYSGMWVASCKGPIANQVCFLSVAGGEDLIRVHAAPAPALSLVRFGLGLVAAWYPSPLDAQTHFVVEAPGAVGVEPLVLAGSGISYALASDGTFWASTRSDDGVILYAVAFGEILSSYRVDGVGWGGWRPDEGLLSINGLEDRQQGIYRTAGGGVEFLAGGRNITRLDRTVPNIGMGRIEYIDWMSFVTDNAGTTSVARWDGANLDVVDEGLQRASARTDVMGSTWILSRSKDGVSRARLIRGEELREPIPPAEYLEFLTAYSLAPGEDQAWGFARRTGAEVPLCVCRLYAGEDACQTIPSPLNRAAFLPSAEPSGPIAVGRGGDGKDYLWLFRP